jgi:hypothetical protein
MLEELIIEGPEPARLALALGFDNGHLRMPSLLHARCARKMLVVGVPGRLGELSKARNLS